MQAVLNISFSGSAIAPDFAHRSFIVPEWCGGVGCFVGVVRDNNHGRQVSAIEYELYSELAEAEFRAIAAEAIAKYTLGSIAFAHRCGRLQVGDYAVVVQTAARHRAQALDGCRFLIDQVKARLPIWKKEWYVDGTHDWPFCSEHHGVHG
jgi:molybdopterin synthase catalytic subunit